MSTRNINQQREQREQDRFTVIRMFAHNAADLRSLALRHACQNILITWMRWACDAEEDMALHGVTTDWTGPLDHLVDVDTTVPAGTTDFAWDAAAALSRIDTQVLKLQVADPFAGL